MCIRDREKAARGKDGLIYPWGNQPDSKAANLGDDYDASPKGKGGKIDGYNLWAPITRVTKDVSPYGVCDMAGNVSEWTAGETESGEWPSHPDYIDIKVAVYKRQGTRWSIFPARLWPPHGWRKRTRWTSW